MNISAIALPRVGTATVLFSGGRDYAVKAWDLASQRCVTKFSTPRNIVTAMETDSTARLLYQCAEDLCLRVWDMRSSSTGPCLLLRDFVYFPMSLVLNEREQQLCCGCKGVDGEGGEVKLYDLRRPSRSLAVFTGHRSDVTAVTYSMGGSRAVLCVQGWRDLSLGLQRCSWNSRQWWHLQLPRYTRPSLHVHDGPSPCGSSGDLLCGAGDTWDTLDEYSVETRATSLRIACERHDRIAPTREGSYPQEI
ncbi:unnamed protein product [Sphagnum jensenii]|uniref:Uncharacterized protein n=1 Tax=Sphagnum jensenii TaxID=128206 RepID=A0ABP0VDS2_9BRYO